MKRFRTVFILDILALVLAFALPGALGIASRPGHALTINPLIIRAVLLAYILATWTALMYYKGKPNLLFLRPLNLLYALVALCLSANFLIAWDVTYRPSWEWLASFGAISFLLLWAVASFCGHRPEDRGRPAGILLLAAGSLFTLSFAVKLVAGYFVWKTTRIPLIIAGTLCLCAFYASAGTERMESFIKKISSTRGWIWAVTGAIVAVIIAATLSQAVLGGIPHISDSVAQLFQAKVLASGRLWAEAPAVPEAFDCEFILIDGVRWYGKYFPGSFLFLAAGVLIGLPWVVNPVIGGASLVLIYLLGRELFDEKTGRLAVLLGAVSPFYLVTSANFMSHTPSLFFSLLFILFALKAAGVQRAHSCAFLAGLFLGLNLVTRPFTAALVAVPTCAYSLIRAGKDRGLLRCFIPFAAGILLVTGLQLCYNRALTGEAFLPPYLKYCPTDFFGSGAYTGLPNVPSESLSVEKVIDYFKANGLTISEDIFGWPRWTFIFMLIPLLTWRRRGEAAYLLCLFMVLATGYAFWWFHQIFFGARYWFEAMPAFLLLAARSLQICYRMADRSGVKPAIFTAALLVFLSLRCATVYLPGIAPRYFREGHSVIWNIDTVLRDALRECSIERGLIFVDSKHYGAPDYGGFPDAYLSAFSLNEPDLTGDIVCVRKMDDETNKHLTEKFPGLPPYLFIHPNPQYSPIRARSKIKHPALSTMSFVN